MRTMRSEPVIAHYFDEQFVQSVRESLLELIKDNSHQYDPRDVEKLRTCDWFVRRFLAWRPTDVRAAANCVSEAMKWRHRLDINHWSDTDFPTEFYRLATCFTYLPDRDGNNVVIIRLKKNRRDAVLRPHFDDLARKYFIWVIEKIVSQNSNRGFAIIFDCHCASLANVDLDFARFIISTLSTYYAGTVVYVCVYELPWIFNQIWKLVRSWLDSDAKKLVRFCTKKEISKLIAPDHLPDYMGGTGTVDYRQVPKGTITVEEMAKQMGIDCEHHISSLSAFFNKLID